MDITITEWVDQQTIVALVGCLDAFHAPALRARLEGLLEKGVKRVVFDLSKVTFLDSAGLAVLVRALKYVQSVDGSVKVLFPLERAVMRMLQLTRFDQIFERVEAIAQS